MIEIPEAVVLSHQLNESIKGKVITDVVTGYSPHKFTFFYGDPQNYASLLIGEKVNDSYPRGGMVEISAGKARIVFGDGANLCYFSPGSTLPDKHQLLIGFDDNSFLAVTVQMYAGLWAFPENTLENPYYLVAGEKPFVLSDMFSKDYFLNLISEESLKNKSAKALLATEQRIPGLGNGTLQDILFNAGIHPKKKTQDLSEQQKEQLFFSIKSTISEMCELGGRDTEKNLFGAFGKYKTKLSKNTSGKPCDKCGSIVVKENYLGGSIYYCKECQPL
ncbi:endonuclease VIII [uncultured Bacteroides sp.]|uniref:endonuclease VIII n=1 Tax=uncultured Bacteroides sp. TaxID=162156 RepID=UPI002AAC05D6|nr:endonuclease VIII [uncultured Bacteroides sp.]